MNLIKKVSLFHALTIVLVLGYASGESKARVTRSIQTSKKPSVAEYRLLIKEKGTQFYESMKINTRDNSVFFSVPAHNNVDKSDVLLDYNLNISITQVPYLRICYIKPLDSFDPSPRTLKVDMKLASTQKLGLSHGITSLAEKWAIDTLVQPRDLSSSVKKHCGDFPVYRLKKMDEDGMIVEKKQVNQTRITRETHMPFLCKKDYPNLGCDPGDWYFRCKWVTNECVYWVICKKSVRQVKTIAECDSDHKWTTVMCCNPTCTSPSG